ncbi:MAG TPA: PIN domain-containing protein [Gemmatimonadota bacterium]|nr:PIN domain-containing protein [Gemmatimonadota bacterium]
MVFIHYLDGHPAYGSLLDPLFDGWESGESQGLASVLVVAETMVGPLRTGAEEGARNAVQWLSGLPGLELVPVSLNIGIRAAEIRARSGLPMADSLHAATALVRGAEVFLTNDRRFARLRELEPVFLDDLL